MAKKFKYKKCGSNKRMILNHVSTLLWTYHGRPDNFTTDFPKTLGGQIIDLINQEKHKAKFINGEWHYSHIDWDVVKLLRTVIKESIPIKDIADCVRGIWDSRLYLENNQCNC